jgi:hypothetical protein
MNFLCGSITYNLLIAEYSKILIRLFCRPFTPLPSLPPIYANVFWKPCRFWYCTLRKRCLSPACPFGTSRVHLPYISCCCLSQVGRDASKRLWEMRQSGWERCVKAAVRDASKRLWEMRQSGWERCVKAAGRDASKRLAEMRQNRCSYWCRVLTLWSVILI